MGASAVPTFDLKLKGPLATVEDYYVDLGGAHANFAQLTLLSPEFDKPLEDYGGVAPPAVVALKASPAPGSVQKGYGGFQVGMAPSSAKLDKSSLCTQQGCIGVKSIGEACSNGERVTRCGQFSEGLGGITPDIVLLVLRHAQLHVAPRVPGSTH